MSVFQCITQTIKNLRVGFATDAEEEFDFRPADNLWHKVGQLYDVQSNLGVEGYIEIYVGWQKNTGSGSMSFACMATNLCKYPNAFFFCQSWLPKK